MHLYKYTCPDVIHMRKVRRNTAIGITIVYTVLSAVAVAWANNAMKDVKADTPTTEETV